VQRRSRPALAAFADEVHVRVGAPVVDEGAEALEFFRVVEGVGPLAFILVDHMLHLRFQLGGQAQAVVEDHLLEVVQPAFQVSRHTEVRCSLSAVRM
jgi:hypothetical protein